ncbi:hypothetical protein [Parafrankia sp. EUN1f]|uniref:hypothetical protein n=1 Tax=Parafrankia sp. EUN1f TaxID=102897 RepID=UPI0001C46D2A|nr:hypothetical protein [Parafrankia sp. EUN1f]EFC80088.1 hypothetical protein FrEUN1fDRAFT_6815 [Parafrankia sp. EUN1f]
MSDLPDDLGARLTAAAAVYYPSSRPDDTTIALAREVRAAGGCAHISTGTNRPNSDPNPWHHGVCIGPPDHLGYHLSVDGMNWSVDRMEYERRAEQTIADLAEQLQHAVEGHIERTSLFREMTTGPDGVHLSLQPAREVVALWAAAARGMLGDAPNYAETPISMPADVDEGRADGRGIEMTVSRAGEMDEFIFRLQRAGRLTPHQAREAAERRADAAEDARGRLRARIRDLVCQRRDATARANRLEAWGPDETSPAIRLGAELDRVTAGLLVMEERALAAEGLLAAARDLAARLDTEADQLALGDTNTTPAGLRKAAGRRGSAAGLRRAAFLLRRALGDAGTPAPGSITAEALVGPEAAARWAETTAELERLTAELDLRVVARPPAVERDEHGRPALGTRVTVTVTGTVDPGRMDGSQVYISASQPELHDDLWLDRPTLTITPAKDQPTP